MDIHYNNRIRAAIMVCDMYIMDDEQSKQLLRVSRLEKGLIRKVLDFQSLR